MADETFENIVRKPVKWNAVAGFDGYVDRLARVVKERDKDGSLSYYASLHEFGTAVRGLAGLSGDREMMVQPPRIGGNAPIFCETLDALGAEGTLIGGLGIPPKSFFSHGIPHFRLISLGECGETLALEFDDGKLMLADVDKMNGISMDTIQKMGLKEASEKVFREGDLVLFANWNQLHHSTELWQHYGSIASGHAKMIYLDLADFSQNSAQSLHSLFSSLHFSYTLGCNEKEASLLCERLFQFRAPDIRQASSLVSGKLHCEVIVHGLDYAAWACGNDFLLRKGRLVQHPAATTGGGDHFNGGYCFARMQGAEIPDALDFGMSVSGAFVSTGKTAGLNECLQYMREHICPEEKNMGSIT